MHGSALVRVWDTPDGCTMPCAEIWGPCCLGGRSFTSEDEQVLLAGQEVCNKGAFGDRQGGLA